MNFFAFGDGSNPRRTTSTMCWSMSLSLLRSGRQRCTDALACNYDSVAEVDDGSCDYSCLGCTDDGASNYNADATVDDGSCTYFAPSCDYVGAPEWGELDFGVFTAESLVFVQGVPASYEVVLNVPAVVSRACHWLCVCSGVMDPNRGVGTA